MENYQGRGCVICRSEAEEDNTNRGLDNSPYTRKPNSIIVLLFIERIKTNIRKETKIHQIFNLF